MDNGMVSAYGPRDEILRTYSENRNKKSTESAENAAPKREGKTNA